MGLELALDAGAGVGLDEASASIVASSSWRAHGCTRWPLRGYRNGWWSVASMLIAYQKYAVACSIGTVGGLAGRHPRGGGAMRPRFSSRAARGAGGCGAGAGARRRGRGVRRWSRLS